MKKIVAFLVTVLTVWLASPVILLLVLMLVYRP
jgi:TM2 domain-containing membrane protein YozV